jgi:hypothetical protein
VAMNGFFVSLSCFAILTQVWYFHDKFPIAVMICS